MSQAQQQCSYASAVGTGASFGVMVIVSIEWGSLIGKVGVEMENTISDRANGHRNGSPPPQHGQQSHIGLQAFNTRLTSLWRLAVLLCWRWERMLTGQSQLGLGSRRSKALRRLLSFHYSLSEFGGSWGFLSTSHWIIGSMFRWKAGPSKLCQIGWTDSGQKSHLVVAIAKTWSGTRMFVACQQWLGCCVFHPRSGTNSSRLSWGRIT